MGPQGVEIQSVRHTGEGTLGNSIMAGAVIPLGSLNGKEEDSEATVLPCLR